MPGALDVMLVILFAVLWPLVEYVWLWPRHVRAVEAGVPGARPAFYARTMLEEWTLVATVMTLTFAFARPLATLGLRAPQGWRLWLGALLPVAYLLLVVAQSRALAAKPAAQERLGEKLRPLRALVPHTAAELRLFVLLSFTAGICEELLFRGYLVWVLRSWIGLGPAAAASMILFGVAHAYQGLKFGIRAFLAGVVVGSLALVTGSILPGMALHALVDLSSGWLTYSVSRADRVATAAAT